MSDFNVDQVSLWENGSLVPVHSPDWFIFLLSWLAPIGSFALFAAGSSTIFQIRKDRSVGTLSIIPFVALLVNCATWSLYALLIQDRSVLFPNAIGGALGALYSWQYLKFVPPEASYAARRNLFVGLFILLAELILLILVGISTGSMIIGRLGAGLAIALLASPLVTVRTVIQEKSTASMPFLISLASFACAASWTLYGWIVASDLNIVVPNFLGLIATTLQLGLFAIYPNAPPPVTRKVWA